MKQKNPKNIVIVGSGNIGSRHYESLRYIKDKNTKVFIFNPLKDFEKCKVMDNKVNLEVFYISDLEIIPDNIFFLIISTNADVRFKLLEILLRKFKVRFLLLEKILFQEIPHYYKSIELCNKYTLRTWVNTPLRQFKAFQLFQKENTNNESFNLKVSGPEWGLACNFIHFIDYFSFLNQSNKIIIKEKQLTKYSSKREGFYDFYGKISGVLNNKSIFFLESSQEKFSKNKKLQVSFFNSFKKLDYFPYDRNYKIIDKRSNKERNGNTRIQVSELTGKWINKVEREGIGLPLLEESVKLHLPFLKIFSEYFDKKNGNKNCQIT